MVIMWRVRRVAATGSTNADVAAAARAGEAEGYVLVADEQTAGRGRLGRPWSSPPGTSLSVSCLLRPPAAVEQGQWSWLPLLVGVATVEAVRDAAGVEARLKWPNDVLLDGGKLAGILVERVEASAGGSTWKAPSGPAASTGAAAVVGVGMNITAAPPGAASLGGIGATRDAVLDALLDRLAARYAAWCADPRAPELPDAYRAVCDTLGRDVRAELPGGDVLTGRAVAIGDAGQLVVETAAGRRALGAGEIVHLRGAVPPLIT